MTIGANNIVILSLLEHNRLDRLTLAGIPLYIYRALNLL